MCNIITFELTALQLGVFVKKIMRSALKVTNTRFPPPVRRDGGAGETTRLQRLFFPQHHRLLLSRPLGLQVRINVIAVRQHEMLCFVATTIVR